MTEIRNSSAAPLFSPDCLPNGWRQCLGREFEQPYMQGLADFLTAELAAGQAIYPPVSDWFRAFQQTDFAGVRVVILGQDPYHGAGQAEGLSFSVPAGVAVPPSLRNIFKEQHRDLGISAPCSGSLLSWSEQGVLLLNATLTVAAGCAGSHQNRGWESFTDKVIALLAEQREGLVFMLWGAYAQKRGALIDRQRHCVLSSSHPSPLSAYRGFNGCGHFSEVNRYLVERGERPVDWQL